MEVHALKQRGWSISAIARHLGRDRKTVRAYLLGKRIPGERVVAETDPFDRLDSRGFPSAMESKSLSDIGLGDEQGYEEFLGCDAAVVADHVSAQIGGEDHCVCGC